MSILNELRRSALVLALLIVAVITAACGRGEAASPTPAPAPTAAAAAETPSPPPPGDDTAMIQVTLEPTPAVGPAAMGGNETIPSADAMTSAPVVIEASPGCVLESDLDLAGYSGLEAVMGCAVTPARTDPVGFNEFGPGPDYAGFMLWVSWEGQIYALLSDGQWQVFADTWTEDQPTFSCNPLGGEPSSPPLPRRGFGKVWCEHADVRDDLGTIEVEERLCQHTVTQEFERGRLIACFEDATIRYYQLFNDGTWAAVLQP